MIEEEEEEEGEGEGVLQIYNYRSGVNCFPRDDFCVPTEMGVHLKSDIFFAPTEMGILVVPTEKGVHYILGVPTGREFRRSACAPTFVLVRKSYGFHIFGCTVVASIYHIHLSLLTLVSYSGSKHCHKHPHLLIS